LAFAQLLDHRKSCLAFGGAGLILIGVVTLKLTH
jgi:hypothetical protein